MSIRFGDAIIDSRRGTVSRSGRLVSMEPRTFHLLQALVDRAGELVEHQTLIDLVWHDTAVTPHSLTEAISQIRRALDDDPREPRIIETVHRRGYRFIAPVERTPEHRAQCWRLPARVVELVDREILIEDLTARLGRVRLLTLVGPGGVGKTQLALEVGRRLEATFADGAVLIDLAPATGEGDVQRLVADAMAISEQPDRGLLESIASGARDLRALLILDNCERVAEAAGRLAGNLLAAATGLRVLATTQCPLGSSGEILMRVAPLSVCTDTDDLPPALRLFELRAAAVQPGFRVAGTHARSVLEICRRLDGLPLAIELAAARTRVVSPSQILERLDSRFDFLSTSGTSEPERHRTLRTLIDWSADLLRPDEARLLNHVAVFRAGWSLEAAAAVMDCEPERDEVLANLTALVDKSLVLADTDGEYARYRLLDSIRLFALDRLDALGEGEVARDRMLCYYADRAAKVDRDWPGADTDRWVERISEERANVRAAFEWALSAPHRADLGLRMAADLLWYWRAINEFKEAQSWLQRAQAQTGPQPPEIRARVKLTLGFLAHVRCEFDAARRLLRESLEDLGADGPPRERALALTQQAFNEALFGDPFECERWAAEALQIAALLRSSWIEASALLARGLASAMRHDHQTAARIIASAHDRSVNAGERFLETYAALNLGLQRLLIGDPSGSRRMFTRALQSARPQNLRGIGGSLEGFAYLAAADGNLCLSARLMGAAARIRDLSGAPLLPHWHHAHATCAAQIEEALGSARAERERADGASRPFDELADMVMARDSSA